MRAALTPNALSSVPPTDLSRLLGMMMMSLASIGTSLFLPFITAGTSTANFLSFAARHLFAEDDRASRRRLKRRALRERYGLPQCRAFFERERTRRVHFTGNEENIRRRNVNDVARPYTHVLIEVAAQQPIDVDLQQFVLRFCVNVRAGVCC